MAYVLFEFIQTFEEISAMVVSSANTFLCSASPYTAIMTFIFNLFMSLLNSSHQENTCTFNTGWLLSC